MAIAGRTNSPAAQGGLLVTVADNPQPNPDGVLQRHPEIQQLPQRTAVVDTQYIPSTHLLAHIEGSNWTVTYYSQQVAKADELKPLQLGTSPAHQQYRRIDNYRFKVNTPLSQSQDDEYKEFQVTGEASLFWSLVPNVGDMFIADVGDGRSGLFTLTETERMSYNKDSCYRVSYVLVSYLTDEYAADLAAKTTSVVVFDLEMLELMDNPFVVESDYQKIVSLRQLDEQLRKHLIERYWAPDVNTYKVPQQVSHTYDVYYTHFIRSLGLYTQSKGIKLYHNGSTPQNAVETLWRAFSEMSALELPYLHRKIYPVSVANFKDQPVQRGIAYSPFFYTLYPVGDFGSQDDSVVITEDLPLKAQVAPLEFPDVPTLNTIPYFYPVDQDDAYVFTHNFYDGDTTKMSVLERLCFNMISGVSVKPEEVLALGRYVLKLRPLEQFYYIPCILTLILYTKRNDIWS